MALEEAERTHISDLKQEEKTAAEVWCVPLSSSWLRNGIHEVSHNVYILLPCRQEEVYKRFAEIQAQQAATKKQQGKRQTKNGTKMAGPAAAPAGEKAAPMGSTSRSSAPREISPRSTTLLVDGVEKVPALEEVVDVDEGSIFDVEDCESSDEGEEVEAAEKEEELVYVPAPRAATRNVIKFTHRVLTQG